MDDTPRLGARSVESLLGETLTEVATALDALPDSAHVRELRAKARSYERILAGWATVPPAGPQRDATFDLVIDLHAKVMTTTKQHSSRPPPRRDLVCGRCGKKAAGAIDALMAAGWTEVDGDEPGRREWGCPGCVVTKPAVSKKALRGQGDSGGGSGSGSKRDREAG
jgi:hypothetical protein